jgi:hypothetical protein
MQAMHRYFLMVPDAWTATSVLSFTRKAPVADADKRSSTEPRGEQHALSPTGRVQRIQRGDAS